MLLRRYDSQVHLWITLLLRDVFRGLAAAERDQPWAGGSSDNDDLATWCQNETRKPALQFVSRAN